MTSRRRPLNKAKRIGWESHGKVRKSLVRDGNKMIHVGRNCANVWFTWIDHQRIGSRWLITITPLTRRRGRG